MAQSVEHILGKDEVVSSILTSSSKKERSYDRFFFCFFNARCETGCPVKRSEILFVC